MKYFGAVLLAFMAIIAVSSSKSVGTGAMNVEKKNIPATCYPDNVDCIESDMPGYQCCTPCHKCHCPKAGFFGLFGGSSGPCRCSEGLGAKILHVVTGC
uniref:Venom peptide U10-SYTX-Sth1c n=1 Tax=Scytodes thoracica TaxID=1112478 RepID=A0A0A0VCE0_SCYTH|nr:venom peptide U10-SYTX-Sth1c [Scytodes thoracica]